MAESLSSSSSSSIVLLNDQEDLVRVESSLQTTGDVDDDDDDDDMKNINDTVVLTQQQQQQQHNRNIINNAVVVIAILDLPIHSCITINGISIILQRSDFIGIQIPIQIPTTRTFDGQLKQQQQKQEQPQQEQQFHFITIRGGNGGDDRNPSSSSIIVGFILLLPSTTSLLQSSSTTTSQQQQYHHYEYFIRRYDPQLEEVSSTNLLDTTTTTTASNSNNNIHDQTTVQNLIYQIENNQIPSHRLLSYDTIITSAKLTLYNKQQQQRTSMTKSKLLLSSSSSSSLLLLWDQCTNYITNDLLQLRNITTGTKIIPGTYHNDFTTIQDDMMECNNEENMHNTTLYPKNKETKTTTTNNIIEDGISISYPPIPILIIGRQNNNNHQQEQQSKRYQYYQHLGTRQFLQSISPSLRTTFCCCNSSSAPLKYENDIFTYTLHTYYKNQWELLLGDIQLSFVLFIRLHCYTSFIHWKDCVAFVSFGATSSSLLGFDVEQQRIGRHVEMYTGFINTLYVQLDSIDDDNDDNDFFQDLNGATDEIDNDNNFLFISLRHLISTSNEWIKSSMQNGSHIPQEKVISYQSSITKLHELLQRKFPHYFPINESNICNSLPTTDISKRLSHALTDSDDDDDDDDSGPVVVSMEEVEASLERVQQQVQLEKEMNQNRSQSNHPQQHSLRREYIQSHYPLLLAAMDSTNHVEDIEMTCARILYDRNDVSLVREAATYLELEMGKTGEEKENV